MVLSRTRAIAISLVVAAVVGLPLAAWLLGVRNPHRQQPPELSGSVRAEEPLAGVAVRFKGTPVATQTDTFGQFHLPLPPAASRITAAKEGFLIASLAADTQPLSFNLTHLPKNDNEAYQWVDAKAGAGSHNCGNCHREIVAEWSASAHARSATGKHLINLYEGSDWDGRPNVGWSLLRDHPDGASVCNACHVPTMPFDGGAYADLRNARGVAAQGVHCDYCHKVQSVGEGKLGQSHGRFNLQLLRPERGQLFFGPLDDVDRGDDAFNPLTKESRYCAVLP